MEKQSLCEVCEAEPAVNYCELCQTFLCLNDTQVHIEVLDQLQHQIIRLSEILTPSSKGFDCKLSESSLSDESFDEFDEGILINEVFAAKINTAEDLRHEHSKNIAKVPLFSSRYDVTDTFKLFKWVMRPEEAMKLIQLLLFQDNVKVVGVYGGLKESFQLVGRVLRLGQPPDFFLEEFKEGIIAFYRSSISTLCLVFQVEDEKIYEKKPYPESSREAIYIRLLLDLCSVVVCCPSHRVMESWYFSSEPSKRHPFLLRIPVSQTIVIQKKTINDELTKISVAAHILKEQFVLTKDHHPFIFSTKFQKNEHADIILEISEKLDAWINSTHKSVQNMNKKYFDRAISQNFKEFDTTDFFALVKLIRDRFEKSSELIATIKAKYANTIQEVQHNIEQMYENFIRELESMFKFKNSLKNIKEEMKIILIHNQQFSQLILLKDQLLDVMTEFAVDSKKFKKVKGNMDRAGEVLQNFLEKNIHSFSEGKNQIIATLFQKLKTKLEMRVVEDVKKQMKGTFTMQAWKVSISDEGVTVEDNLQTSKHPLSFHYEKSQMYVFEEQIMFLFIENETHFKATALSPIASFSNEIDHIINIDSPVLLASGSSASLFVAFQNRKALAYYGSARDNIGIDNGTPLNIYGSSVQKVLAACVLHINRNWVLIIINEAGVAFSMSLVSREKQLLPIFIESAPGKPKSKTPLCPDDGSRFYDVTSDPDESHLFFLTATAIEIRTLYYEKMKAIRIEHPEISFKVISWKMFSVILVQDGLKLEAYRFTSKREWIESVALQEQDDEIPGNPVIDILYYALLKFGPLPHFQKQPPALYVYSSESLKEISEYINGIENLSHCIRWQGILPPDDLWLSEDLAITTREFRWRLLTRAPLHLASIQDKNLIPLQDGFNNFAEFLSNFGQADPKFVSSCVEYIRFGHFEELIRESTNIKVVSIIGKQSSGKSYLMNRLFATRFDVASHRCTDGIWMSLAKVDDQVFLIFDCEGLFSAERSVQEEIKLILFLAAVSDVLILNQDLTFNRNLTSLFDKFAGGLEKLSGKNIFKGCLEIALRDVAPNQNAGAMKEMKKFIGALISAEKINHLITMFSGEFQYSAYPNFEKGEEFESMIIVKRKYYVNSLSCHWQQGDELLIFLKTVLAQIYIDDGTVIDSRLIQLKLDEVLNKIYPALDDPSLLKAFLRPNQSVFTYKAKISSFSLNISFKIDDIALTRESSFATFDQYFEQRIDQRLKKYEWKGWYEAVDGFVVTYFQYLGDIILDYFQAIIGKVEEEYKKVIESEKDNIKSAIEKVLLNRHKLCRRKCKHCYLFCLKTPEHPGDCECSTSHTCQFQCAQCPLSAACVKPFGHSEPHICIKCLNPPPENFICTEKCEMYPQCKNSCISSQLTPHKQHRCNQQLCPFPCEMKNCPGTCCSEHFHSSRTWIAKFLKYFSKEKHFCGAKHPCTADCEADGICSLEKKLEPKLIDAYPHVIQYEDIIQSCVRNRCSSIINEMHDSHTGSHKCTELHTCSACCPDCGVFCELPTQHEGRHSSARHHRKTRCIYLSVWGTVIVPWTSEERVQRFEFEPGASAAIETCFENCARKGRGHTHPILCKGRDKCLHQQYRLSAQHFGDQLLPYKGKKSFDLVECSLYWDLFGWKPPVSDTFREVFSMCPFFVSYNGNRLYCNERLFHTDSTNLESHHFSKRYFSNLDVCFIIDQSCLVQEHLSKVYSSLSNLINRSQSTYKIRISIISYFLPLDPQPNPKLPMLSIYPQSCDLNHSDPTKAIQFLSSLTALTQAPPSNSPLFEEMEAVNSLKWRDTAMRQIVIITVNEPTAREFAIANSESSQQWKRCMSSVKEADCLVKVLYLKQSERNIVKMMERDYPERVVGMEMEEFERWRLEEEILTVMRDTETLELAKISLDS